jgi:biotin carboxyl carrier protein
MENEVVAAIAGTVNQVLVGKGSVVKTGDPLVMIH